MRAKVIQASPKRDTSKDRIKGAAQQAKMP
jgi:hypothetical protein